MAEITKTTEQDQLIEVRKNGILLDETAAERATKPTQVKVTLNPYGRNLLCCNMEFNTYGIAYKYGIRVRGTTEDQDFYYYDDTYQVKLTIPLIGLYATKSTSYTVYMENTEGDVWELSYTSSRALAQDFGDHVLKIDIDIADRKGAEATIGNGWLFVGSYMDAYDQNGDIRVCGLGDHVQGQYHQKIHNGYMYIPTEQVFYYFAEHYDKVNIMGQKVGVIDAPEGYGFHHDVTWDNEGYLYALASPLTAQDPDNKREGVIYKYNDETGELLAQINYGKWYDGAIVGLDSEDNDCHFNSIAYVPEIDQLVVNSRNSSHYMAIDKHAFLPIWSVQNPDRGPQLLDPRINLQIVNPQKHVYINGAHTVFPCYNEKYDAYWRSGKIVLSIFDNTACKDENGKDIVKVCEDPTQDDDAGYLWDAAISVVAVDPSVRTLEQIDYYTVPGERSRITSNVFDSYDKRYFYYHIGVPSHFYVVDKLGKVVLSAKNLFPNVHVDFDYTYRARIYDFTEIRTLIPKP